MNHGNCAVHILGCHLEADGWEDIVWGRSGFGRIKTGITLAWERKAVIISWGTGASRWDGVAESRYTFNLALHRYRDLAGLCGADPGHDVYESPFRQWLERVSVIDEVTQNTHEEVKRVADLCNNRGLTELVLVTSPFHTPRTEKIVDILMRGKPEYRSLYRNTTVRRSETSLPGVDPSNEVTIIEKVHRGDMWKPPAEIEPHMLARRMFKMYRDPAKLELYLRAWDDLLAEYGV